MDSSTKNNCEFELYQTFEWFNDNITLNVLEAAQNYWEADFEIMLLSLTTNDTVKDDYTSKGEIYFTVQIPTQGNINPSVRISSEFARLFLHDFFGSNSPTFKLIDLSELEIKILNSFADFLYRSFEKVLLPVNEIPKVKLKEKGVYNLTFLIKKENIKPAKIVITIPRNRLNPEKIDIRDNFTFDDFLKISTFVNIETGSSKITLNDLKNLYPGDIIFLENSNVNIMEIKTDKIKKTFKVNPDPNLMIELDEDINDIGAEIMDNKNIWDDIQIEVNAEFEKVKMTLGDLKQISKGLVIDLGPVLHNKISLLVENKIVATGELVIINDKYGVKIEEVISSNTNTKNNANEPGSQAQKSTAGAPVKEQVNEDMVQKMAQNTQNAEQEEFDYSDFENDEE